MGWGVAQVLQPRPVLSSTARLSVRPRIASSSLQSALRLAVLCCRLDLLLEEPGGAEGWGGSAHTHRVSRVKKCGGRNGGDYKHTTERVRWTDAEKGGRRIIKGWKRVSMMGWLAVVAMVEEKRREREFRHYYYQQSLLLAAS